MFPLQESSVLRLSETEGKQILSFLKENIFDPYAPDEAFEKFINHSYLLTRMLPEPILSALLQFRRDGNDDGTLIIKGLPLDDQVLGPTPRHWSKAAWGYQRCATEMYLTGLATLLGEVFAFRTQHEGNVIQNIVPMPGDTYEQVGTGSKVFLEWHTEDAFHQYRAHYIGLLCLRSDPLAATTFASVKHMRIPEPYRQVLFENKFQAGIDKAHGGTGRPEEGPIISIFSGRNDHPFLRVDMSCVRALPGETEAQIALEYLGQAMNAAGRQLTLEQGDVLFMDNFSLVHGRTPFIPRFDGTDRWLQRVSITTDFRKSYPYRTKNYRVIEPGASLLG